MLPTNSEYVALGAFIAAYVILKLNVFPKISARVPARSLMVAIFCALVLLNLHVYHKEVERQPEDRRVSPAEERLQELRRALPPEGHVGFISDKTLDSSVDSLERYFLTQYALAPIVLDEGTSPNLIIGNFKKFDAKLIPDDLVLVRAFGPGLMLFRRRVE